MFERGTVTRVADPRGLLEPVVSARPFAVLRADRGSVLDGTPGKAARLHRSWLAALSPAERFTHETGLPAVPEHDFFADPRTEDAARSAQTRLVGRDRVARIGDAHRTVALLERLRHDGAVEVTDPWGNALVDPPPETPWTPRPPTSCPHHATSRGRTTRPTSPARSDPDAQRIGA